jgi:hypothetical protein
MHEALNSTPRAERKKERKKERKEKETQHLLKVFRDDARNLSNGSEAAGCHNTFSTGTDITCVYSAC